MRRCKIAGLMTCVACFMMLVIPDVKAYNDTLSVTADRNEDRSWTDVSTMFPSDPVGPVDGEPDLIRVDPISEEGDKVKKGLSCGTWEDLLYSNVMLKFETEVPQEGERVEVSVWRRYNDRLVHFVKVELEPKGSGGTGENGDPPVGWAEVKNREPGDLVLTDLVSGRVTRDSTNESNEEDLPLLLCNINADTGKGNIKFWLEGDHGQYRWISPGLDLDWVFGCDSVTDRGVSPGEYTVTVKGDGGFERKIAFVTGILKPPKLAETPETNGVYSFLPMHEDWGWNPMVSELRGQGYNCVSMKDSNLSDDIPGPTIPTWQTVVERGYNFWIQTHTFCVEFYASESGRDNAFDTYNKSGSPYRGLVEKKMAQRHNGDLLYSIAIKAAALGQWVDNSQFDPSQNQILFWASCRSSDAADELSGGLELTYSGATHSAWHSEDAHLLFGQMNGSKADNQRLSGKAINDPAGGTYHDFFHVTGESRFSTVLAPSLYDWGPTEGHMLSSSINEHVGWVVFDCNMDTSQNPVTAGQGVSIVDGSGYWINPYTYIFAFTGSSGSFTVVADRSVSANCEKLRLDGGTPPDYGVDPAGDDFVWGLQ